MKERQKNPQRADDGQKFQTDSRKETDRNDETGERWKADKNFRGQKTDKISNRKDRERDRTGKISEGTKNTHRQKTEGIRPIFQSVRPNNSRITCQKR